MGADAAAGKQRRILRLGGPDHEVGVALTERAPDARNRATRADARAEAMDGAAHILDDLERSVLLVGREVVRVLELLRHVDARVRGGQSFGLGDALLHARADVALVMDDNHLSPIMAHQLAPLLRDGVGHNDNRAVALDRADQRQANALIAAGGLHNNGILENEKNSRLI